MKKCTALLVLFLLAANAHSADEIDLREKVEMPPPMKAMFLMNMRSHMESLDLIIEAIAENNLNDAAAIAETTMGTGGVDKRQCDDSAKHQHQHNGEHKKKAFGKFMPTSMKAMGMQLHVAADNFAVIAREGDIAETYKSLSKISASCVACHQSFRVQ